MGVAAERAIELIEAASAASQHGCAEPATQRRLVLSAEWFGSAAPVVARKSQNLYFNRLIAAGQRSPLNESGLDRVLATAARLGVDRLAVAVTPRARPRNLVEWRHSGVGNPAAAL